MPSGAKMTSITLGAIPCASESVTVGRAEFRKGELINADGPCVP